MVITDEEKILLECRQNAVDWTRELVRLNSENPPGREIECADFCAGVLRGLGMETAVDEFAPGRANAVGYAGNRSDLGIVFNGHLDVVVAQDEWKDPPFAANLHDGCVWGRGSADMKSGCAAGMAAVKYLLKTGWDFSEKGIALTFVADEEQVNQGSIRLSKTTRLQADACVVCEPTQLCVCYGNRGYTSFYIRTYGKRSHACEPHNGVNAIYKMAHVLEKLEHFADVLAQRKNDQLGHVSLSVGKIHGGVSLNTVPDFCEIEVESRVFPGMDAETMRGELQEFLGGEAEVAVRSNLLASLVPADSRIVREAAASVEQATGRSAVVTKFPACSEASFFSVGYGIPTILMGPGDISCAHKANEFVPVREIEDAVGIYVGLIRRYTGASASKEP